MTARRTVIVHVPVEIVADSNEALRSIVHALKHTGLKHSEAGVGRGSFKIITNGVKLRDVKEQFERLYTQKSGDSEDGDPWPFPKKAHQEEHPRAKNLPARKKIVSRRRSKNEK